MKRVDLPTKEAVIVSRQDFDKDYELGYVAIEYNPERTVTIKDHRSNREIKQVLLPDIVYRCVDCQFDTMERKLIDDHRMEGKHPWAYGPFKNPYGYAADVEIEGIADYQTFLKEKQ